MNSSDIKVTKEIFNNSIMFFHKYDDFEFIFKLICNVVHDRNILKVIFVNMDTEEEFEYSIENFCGSDDTKNFWMVSYNDANRNSCVINDRDDSGELITFINEIQSIEKAIEHLIFITNERLRPVANVVNLNDKTTW